jgi:hypothetical protein
MGYLSAGEDAGEVTGPILAGFLWSMWGVPALLGVRIAFAVVTEVYTIALTRSLGRLETDATETTPTSAAHEPRAQPARRAEIRWEPVPIVAARDGPDGATVHPSAAVGVESDTKAS